MGRLQVTTHDERAPGNQSKTKRPAELPAPRRILLDPHYSTKHKHPANITAADDEHQQHDRPAAADAEHTVMRAEQERIASRCDAMPSLLHKMISNFSGVRHLSKQ